MRHSCSFGSCPSELWLWRIGLKACYGTYCVTFDYLHFISIFFWSYHWSSSRREKDRKTQVLFFVIKLKIRTKTKKINYSSQRSWETRRYPKNSSEASCWECWPKERAESKERTESKERAKSKRRIKTVFFIQDFSQFFHFLNFISCRKTIRTLYISDLDVFTIFQQQRAKIVRWLEKHAEQRNSDLGVSHSYYDSFRKAPFSVHPREPIDHKRMEIPQVWFLSFNKLFWFGLIVLKGGRGGAGRFVPSAAARVVKLHPTSFGQIEVSFWLLHFPTSSLVLKLFLNRSH